MLASDAKPDSRLFALFVSRSGGGKSCAAMSCLREGKQGKVFDFDLRKGYLGMKETLPLDRWVIEQYPPLTSYMIGIEKELESLNSMFKQRQWPFDTLLFDSGGSMARILLTDSLEYSKGNTKGQTRLSGPVDYNYQSQALLQIFDYLRSLPCNIIVTCHLTPRWVPGKERDKEGHLIEYQDKIQDGEELTITKKLGETVMGYFDEVYKFSCNEDRSRFYVEFYTDVARSVYKMPRGKQDITGKNFYQYWLGLVGQKEEKASG